MVATGQASVTFAGTSAVLDLGRKGFKQVMIWVPTLSTDTSLTVSVSYDGATYLTLNRIEGADNQTDVIINSARCQVIDIAGARYIKLTGSNAQTITVNAIAIPY